MICRTYCVEVTEYADLTFPGTDIVAVVRCRLDGEDLEILVVRCDAHGEVTVCANVELPVDGAQPVSLADHFGGVRILRLPVPARARVVEAVFARVVSAHTEVRA